MIILTKENVKKERKYINENTYAEKIEKALYKTLKSGISTVDIGGTASTTEFRDAIIKNL